MKRRLSNGVRGHEREYTGGAVRMRKEGEEEEGRERMFVLLIMRMNEEETIEGKKKEEAKT